MTGIRETWGAPGACPNVNGAGAENCLVYSPGTLFGTFGIAGIAGPEPEADTGAGNNGGGVNVRGLSNT